MVKDAKPWHKFCEGDTSAPVKIRS